MGAVHEFDGFDQYDSFREAWHAENEYYRIQQERDIRMGYPAREHAGERPGDPEPSSSVPKSRRTDPKAPLAWLARRSDLYEPLPRPATSVVEVPAATDLAPRIRAVDGSDRRRTEELLSRARSALAKSPVLTAGEKLALPPAHVGAVDALLGLLVLASAVVAFALWLSGATFGVGLVGGIVVLGLAAAVAVAGERVRDDRVQSFNKAIDKHNEYVAVQEAEFKARARAAQAANQAARVEAERVEEADRERQNQIATAITDALPEGRATATPEPGADRPCGRCRYRIPSIAMRWDFGPVGPSLPLCPPCHDATALLVGHRTTGVA